MAVCTLIYMNVLQIVAHWKHMEISENESSFYSLSVKEVPKWRREKTEKRKSIRKSENPLMVFGRRNYIDYSRGQEVRLRRKVHSLRNSVKRFEMLINGNTGDEDFWRVELWKVTAGKY